MLVPGKHTLMLLVYPHKTLGNRGCGTREVIAAYQLAFTMQRCHEGSFAPCCMI